MKNKLPAIKSAKMARKVPRHLTSDEIVEGIVTRMQQVAFNATGRPLGYGNAVRRILGLPEARGMVDSEMTDPMEIARLKAFLFDNFIRIYGADLATALRLRAKQKSGAKKGVSARQSKAEIKQAEIMLLVSNLTAAGKPKRSIAGIVAAKTGVTPKHVRGVIKKRK